VANTKFAFPVTSPTESRRGRSAADPAFLPNSRVSESTALQSEPGKPQPVQDVGRPREAQSREVARVQAGVIETARPATACEAATPSRSVL